jgi:hypothetical protein
VKPILICLTPVRNEAWCLKVFLESTSKWADHIIIADQKSTDGSKEIALQYSKVILIDNPNDEYSESERQKLLISEARKINGDKIIFALDADEIFTSNFQYSDDWQKILNSKKGDVFGFQWANIYPDLKHYFPSTFYYPWVFHDDGITEHKNYVKEIHSMRIPFPSQADMGWYHVNDFKVFHFAYINKKRVKSKWRYYQFIEKIKGVHSNPITSFRSYSYKKETRLPVPKKWIQDYETLFKAFELDGENFWFDEEVSIFIEKYGIETFGILPIWDRDAKSNFMSTKHLKDPRNWFQKLLHSYLEISQPLYPSPFVNMIDKILKLLFK